MKRCRVHRGVGFACIALLARACGDNSGLQPASNPGFDACPPAPLCDWMSSGEVRSVATWHEADEGVELLGAPVSLWQQVDPFSGGPCLTFQLVADVAAEADVAIRLDFGDDGNAEYTDAVPAAHWTLLTYQHPVPEAAERLRISIDKRAQGRAVFARLQLSVGTCGQQ